MTVVSRTVPIFSPSAEVQEEQLNPLYDQKFFSSDRRWRYLIWDYIKGKPDYYPPSVHTHTEYALTTHTHGHGDHTHLVEDITDFGGPYSPLIHDHSWNDLLDKPNTLAGYGIVDAAAMEHDHFGVYMELNDVDNMIYNSMVLHLNNYNHSLIATMYAWGNHATFNYANAGHNHNSTYSLLGHTHDYAASTHYHDWTSIQDKPTSFNAAGLMGGSLLRPLQVMPATESFVPLNFPAGFNEPTSPQDGDMWYYNGALNFRKDSQTIDVLYKGSLESNKVVISGDYWVTQMDGELFIFVDANPLIDYTDATINVYLPTSIGCKTKITIKKIDSTANSVTIQACEGDWIEEDVVARIEFQNTSVRLVLNNNIWEVS